MPAGICELPAGNSDQTFVAKFLENSMYIKLVDKRLQGAVYNCQHLNECTKHTLSQIPPPPPQKVYTSTFFKWIICHENDENWLKC